MYPAVALIGLVPQPAAGPAAKPGNVNEMTIMQKIAGEHFGPGLLVFSVYLIAGFIALVAGLIAYAVLSDDYDAWMHPQEYAARVAAEARQHRMEGGLFLRTDFASDAWPWPKVDQVQLQCHGSKAWPMLTLTMPDGKEYGLNGTAQDAGWKSILKTLKKGRDGTFDPPVPDDLMKDANALCPDQPDTSAYDRCFNKVDGAPAGVVDAVQRGLRDPDSFDLINVMRSAPDAHGVLEFHVKFRAKNGFGGMNLGDAHGHMQVSDCKISLDGIDDG
ncbi:hypothetical protein [Silvimonas sp.]|uniref:hypothetical protein n=1 Tax=Silvimonas sp. TaxID=2650811 RepID=UPI0028476A7E|nr:hypothetical protein [Silvimonas sp.]MDR3425815.1 hypothetical protein [Silvimonas sp.]